MKMISLILTVYLFHNFSRYRTLHTFSSCFTSVPKCYNSYGYVLRLQYISFATVFILILSLSTRDQTDKIIEYGDVPI